MAAAVLLDPPALSGRIGGGVSPALEPGILAALSISQDACPWNAAFTCEASTLEEASDSR